jgi:AhpD family alkylhydroperoxidase
MMELKEFKNFRERMNEKILSNGTLEVKRFFHLDSEVYKDGALPARVKELLGLVASLVLRCNDCVLYHLIQCHKAGITDEEIWEAWSVALIVGGSIVIPHLRVAVDMWQKIKEEARLT